MSVRTLTKELINAPGSGTTLTLTGSAPTGFRTFAAGYANNAPAYYMISDGAQSELNSGVFTTTGAGSLTRGVPIWTSTGSASRLSFTGQCSVYSVVPPDRDVYSLGDVEFSSATTSVTFSLPAKFRRYRLEINVTATGGGALFSRFSQDTVTYMSFAGDYAYTAQSIRSGGAVMATGTQTFLPLSDSTPAGGYVFSTFEFDTVQGRGLYDSHAIMSTPSLARYSGTFNLAFSGVLTNVLVGLTGTTMAAGRVRLLGGM